MCQDERVTFNLFDEERPFLQTAYRGKWDQKPKPVTILDYTAPNGNNHIHFDHRRDQSAYTPGKALRMMLTAQIFCTAGVQGYPSNVNGAPPWFALIRGGSRCSRPLRLGCWQWVRSGYPLTGRLFCGGTQKKWRTRSRWRRHPGCLGCCSRPGGST